MSDNAFSDFTEKALTLSYEQTLFLMEKLVKNLQNKTPINDFETMQNDVINHHMNNVWEELQNDSW